MNTYDIEGAALAILLERAQQGGPAPHGWDDGRWHCLACGDSSADPCACRCCTSRTTADRGVTARSTYVEVLTALRRDTTTRHYVCATCSCFFEADDE